MTRAAIFLTLAGALLTTAGSPVQERAPVLPAQPADGRCRALGGPLWGSLPEAPSHVTAATIVPATAELPAYCEVTAYIAPQIGVVVRLPVDGWNGKLLQIGCGGYCGVNMIRFGDEGLKRGYATTATDMGHQSTQLDGKWAYNNLQGKVDFAWRSTHANTILAKALVKAFYGAEQRRAYFQGCSTGGRQAMLAAQRFPTDFDGIIAGAPAMYYTTSSFEILWSGLANLGPKGEQIIGPRDAEVLHAAVLAKCDMADNLKDGLVEDPRMCRFDPAEIQCRPGQAGGQCLSAAQVDAARKIYQGPLDAKGNPIHIGSFPLGSELTWLNRVIGEGGKPGYNISWMEDRFRYMAFTLDPGPMWQIRDLDWNGDPDRAGGLGYVYSANNPDLRRFKAAGGKLIHYQGWQDPSVVPMQSVDYFELASRTMGGVEATQDFYRLFMIPGMGHCGGGEAADKVDYLTALENWVEKGQAPERLTGAHVEGGRTTFTRPFFPYPDVARYAGKGDTADAANFRRVAGDRAFEKAPLR